MGIGEELREKVGKLSAMMHNFWQKGRSLARELKSPKQREQAIRRGFEKREQAIRREFEKKEQLLVHKLHELKHSNSERESLYQARIANTIRIDSPLVLISQIQRTGGTLLGQLFDGHPECYAHPYELYIGFPDKATWPVLDLNDNPDMWFNILFEPPVERLYREGYHKYSRGVDTNPDRFPFIFLSGLQRKIFNRCIDELGDVKSQREVFDCYMTSYFNAWLDNQNLYSTPKKIITAFVPRMNISEENIERFLNVYPDGKLISMIREPKDWYVSARKHLKEVYENISEAIGLWMASVDSTIRNKKQHGDRVFILSYEDLVTDTEAVMRCLAEYLDINFNKLLLIPTFNDFPIKANSSYQVRNYGVINNSIGRYKKVLSGSEIKFIESQAIDLYEEVKQYLGSRSANSTCLDYYRRSE
jgi:hypothetical protein